MPRQTLVKVPSPLQQPPSRPDNRNSTARLPLVRQKRKPEILAVCAARDREITDGRDRFQSYRALRLPWPPTSPAGVMASENELEAQPGQRSCPSRGRRRRGRRWRPCLTRGLAHRWKSRCRHLRIAARPATQVPGIAATVPVIGSPLASSSSSSAPRPSVRRQELHREEAGPRCAAVRKPAAGAPALRCQAAIISRERALNTPSAAAGIEAQRGQRNLQALAIYQLERQRSRRSRHPPSPCLLRLSRLACAFSSAWRRPPFSAAACAERPPRTAHWTASASALRRASSPPAFVRSRRVPVPRPPAASPRLQPQLFPLPPPRPGAGQRPPSLRRAWQFPRPGAGPTRRVARHQPGAVPRCRP